MPAQSKLRRPRAWFVVAAATGGTLLGITLIATGDPIEAPSSDGRSASQQRPAAATATPSSASPNPEPGPTHELSEDVTTAADIAAPGSSMGELAIPQELNAAGLSAPEELEQSESVVVTEAGAVIENLDVRGTITVKADNVTIRNVRVSTDTDALAVQIARGASGTLIENCIIEMGVAGTTANAGIGGVGDHHGVAGTEPGSNVTVRLCRIHGLGDGIKAANFSLYERNVIQVERGPDSRKHVDGIQASGSSGWTARENWIDQAYREGSNSAIFAQPYTGKRDTIISDITIVGNWVNGGTYTIQIGKPKSDVEGLVSNLTIEDNVFFDDFKYGAYLPRGDVSGDGGTWAASGTPVSTGRLSNG